MQESPIGYTSGSAVGDDRNMLAYRYRVGDVDEPFFAGPFGAINDSGRLGSNFALRTQDACMLRGRLQGRLSQLRMRVAGCGPRIS